jgi:hypothetical protein
MRALCLDAAQSIVKRIKFYCEQESPTAYHAQEVKTLTEALSQLDNIIYAEKESERGKEE